MPAPAGVAKLSIAALKRTISRAGLSTDGLIERRELEAEATRALQILEERWRESSDDEESPQKSKPKTKISTKTKSQKPRGYIAPAAAEIEGPAAPRASRLAIHLSAAAAGLLVIAAAATFALSVRLQPRAGRGAAALVRPRQLGGAVRGARGVMM